MINPFEEIESKLNRIEALILNNRDNPPMPTPSPDDPLNDFVPKHEVRGVIASSATLWKMEQSGKLKGYGFGGKRYYKRSELLELFEEVKIKGL